MTGSGRQPGFRLLPIMLSAAAVWGDVLGAQSPVGVFAAQTDVGRARGSASYDAAQQTYQIAGSGQNMWDARDDFHFVWKRVSGNFILSTRARFIGAGVEEHRKIGWTIRPSLDPGSAHVTAALHGNGLMSLQFRRQPGGLTEEAKSADSLPDPDAVIQLERRDGEYFMSVARFGDTLVTQRLTTVSLPDTVYVGLFVCAHNDTVIERATFSNVRITIPAQRDVVPYRDASGRPRAHSFPWRHVVAYGNTNRYRPVSRSKASGASGT
jgi:TolB protein